MNSKWFKIFIAAAALTAVLMTAMYVRVIRIEKEAQAQAAEAEQALQEAMQGLQNGREETPAQKEPEHEYAFGLRESLGDGHLALFTDYPLGKTFLISGDRVLAEDEHHSLFICKGLTEDGKASLPYIQVTENGLSKDPETAARAYGALIEAAYSEFGLEVTSPFAETADTGGKPLYAVSYQYTILGQTVTDREYFLETEDALYVVGVKGIGGIPDDLAAEAFLVIDSLNDSSVLSGMLREKTEQTGVQSAP
jgi:hypothetical protein